MIFSVRLLKCDDVDSTLLLGLLLPYVFLIPSLLHYISLTAFFSVRARKITILDFNEARDDRVAVASSGAYANHLHLAPDRQPRQYLPTHFLQARCPSCHPTNSIKVPKALRESWYPVYFTKMQKIHASSTNAFIQQHSKNKAATCIIYVNMYETHLMYETANIQ